MTRSRQIVLMVVVAVAAAAGGYAFHRWGFGGGENRRASEAVMATRLADLHGAMQPLGQWRGKVLVVNFWATWCAPCREEIPGFVRLQQKYAGRGLQFVGIAIDHRDKVQAFADEFGMNYPILLGGIDTIEMSRRTGNRVGALPYTLIIDRTGQIVGRELGGVKEVKLEKLVERLL